MMLSCGAATVLVLFLIRNSFCGLGHSFKTRDNITGLVRDLMERYKDISEPFLPPWNDNLDPVEVNLSWYPTNILLFNERDQFIEFGGLMIMEWHDPVLQWDSNVTGIRSVDLPLKKIWKPKLALQESRSDGYASIFYENHLASVQHNGTVSWTSAVKTSTFCRVLETRFPFDQQACKLTFSSSVRYQKGIKFNYLNTTMESIIIANGAWKVGSVIVANCSKVVTFKIGAAIRFVVGLKSQKRQRYYMVTLVIPCVLLSGFTPLVLFIPGETDSKVPLLTFHIVTIFLYQGLVDGVGPPTGNSFISMFVLLTMIETAVVTILSIISTRLYHRKALSPGRLNCTSRPEKKESTPTAESELAQVTESLQKPLAEPGEDDLQNSGEKTPLFKGEGNRDKETSLSRAENDNTERNMDGDNIDVDKFDCTAGFIIIFIKCIWYIAFIIMYRLSRNNPSEIIQCSDDYGD